MKKTFRLENLDCAIDGVNQVSVSFLTQRMTLDADDGRFDEIAAEAVKKCRKVEPDCIVHI